VNFGPASPAVGFLSHPAVPVRFREKKRPVRIYGGKEERLGPVKE
jgi:hypothetical protein